MPRRPRFNNSLTFRNIEKAIQLLDKDISKIYEDFHSNDQFHKDLEQMSYPYGLNEWMNTNLFNNLRSKYRKFQTTEVKKDIMLKREFQIDIQKKYSLEFYEKESLKIKSGLEYFKYGKSASDLVKPALYYYATNQIYSTLINLLLKINIKQNHGLKLSNTENEVNIGIGFFTKLVLFLEFSTGWTNIFSKLYLNITENQYFKEFKITSKINLLEIYEIFEKTPARRIENWHNTTEILIHYINLFYFCSLSRYNPKKWSKVLKGTTQIYKIYKQTINQTNKMVDLMINKVKTHTTGKPGNKSELFIITEKK